MPEELDLSPWNSYPSGTADRWERRYAPLVSHTEDFDFPEAPDLSVIVVAWNSPGFVLEALDHIRAAAHQHDGRVEIILMDNGGLDDAIDGIRVRVHKLVRMVGNVRLCRARNLAAALAQAPILVFLDDDGLVLSDHLINVGHWFADPSICAIRGRIIFKEHRYFTTLAEHYDLGDEALDDYLVTEGNMAIRRDAYIAAGGFNETLAGNEGIDLTFRLRRLNPKARIKYVPDVVLCHDFLNSWAKFKRKFTHYAGIDQQLLALDPGLNEFLDEYRKIRHKPRGLTGLDRLAKWLLTKLKKRLQRRAQRAMRRA